jgi:hypothetical protein
MGILNRNTTYAHRWGIYAYTVFEYTPLPHLCKIPKRGLEQNEFQVAKYIRYISIKQKGYGILYYYQRINYVDMDIIPRTRIKQRNQRIQCTILFNW